MGRWIAQQQPIVLLDADGTVLIGTALEKNKSVYPHAISFIKKLFDMGCFLILWTSREGEFLDDAINTLKRYDILQYFTKINQNIESKYQAGLYDARKVWGDYLLDDLSVDFKGKRSWKRLFKTVKKDPYFKTYKDIKNEKMPTL